MSTKGRRSPPSWAAPSASRGSSRAPSTSAWVLRSSTSPAGAIPPGRRPRTGTSRNLTDNSLSGSTGAPRLPSGGRPSRRGRPVRREQPGRAIRHGAPGHPGIDQLLHRGRRRRHGRRRGHRRPHGVAEEHRLRCRARRVLHLGTPPRTTSPPPGPTPTSTPTAPWTGWTSRPGRPSSVPADRRPARWASCPSRARLVLVALALPMLIGRRGR